MSRRLLLVNIVTEMLLSSSVILLLFIFPALALTAPSPDKDTSKIFYVDAKRGNDSYNGSIDTPFQTLSKALDTVRERVSHRILSDKIYLRGGIYRNEPEKTVIYPLELKGTSKNYALLSAMPAKPHSPGAVQRKSGRWYERVVIDDGFVIDTPWTRLKNNKNIWITHPGYPLAEWNNALVKRAETVEITDKDKTPETTLFTLAPYMVLQDNKPLLWADNISELRSPGMRTYVQATDSLYIRTIGDIDPNYARIESWTSAFPSRTRAIFDGNLEYAAIEGMEFRLFTRLFAHHLAYKSEKDRIIQRSVRIKDNEFDYGWIHIFTDVGGHNFQGYFKPKWGPLAPHFDDISGWVVTNNIFYHASREIFQPHGPNHIFEKNSIIEYGPPWAGRMAFTSAVNTRNTENAIIRDNFIHGLGNNKWWGGGGIFMIELSSHHQTESGDCIYGGQTFENNIFVNLTRGNGIYLGRGSCRMKNITIRNNIFKYNTGSAAILITTPHTNLSIHNNIFYEQHKAIYVYNESGKVDSFGTTPLGTTRLPSSISIRDNVFMKNQLTIDPKLLHLSKKNNIIIDRNLFYSNKGLPVGTHPVNGNPMFLAASKLDFHTKMGSACVLKDEHDIGTYNAQESVGILQKWWLYMKNQPGLLTPDTFD